MIVGFTELAYGADYLEVALRSVLPYVDKYFIAYSPYPTHGGNPYVCPDTREQLCAIAHETCFDMGVPLKWYDNPGDWGRYDQRNSVFEYTSEEDLMILTDADEVWSDGAVQSLIDIMQKSTDRFYRVPIRFFWRSFDHVCYYRDEDITRPLRGFDLSVPREKGNPSTFVQDMPYLNEFGFARLPRDMAYKLPSHGHYREDQVGNWFNDVWLPWTLDKGQMHNVHPYQDGAARFPILVPFDKAELPEYMGEHPYWKMDMIGDNEQPVLEMLV